MLVFGKAKRKNPTLTSELTPSERRLQGYLLDAAAEIRRYIAGRYGEFTDAFAHMPWDRVADMLPLDPWVEAAEKIAAELFGDLVAGGERVDFPTMTKATVSFRFDSERPEAGQWAQSQAGRLIVEVQNEQRALVQDLSSRASLGEFAPRDVAARLRDGIGLTDRQQGWVRNFHDRALLELRAEGLSDGDVVRRAQELTDAYHERIHRYRTETIARTEILSASHEGRRQAWSQGISEGFISSFHMQEWLTVGDPCDICAPFNGMRVRIDDVFPQGDPPAHPNCRCDVILMPPEIDPDIAAMTDEELEQALQELISDAADYRMNHRPDSEGALLSDIEQVFPGFYQNPEWYGTGQPFDVESVNAILAAKDDPDAMITIYRAVPPGVDEINPGDWVTTSQTYAMEHGMHESDPSLDWPVLEMQVPASELTSDGNSIHEWGWFPSQQDDGSGFYRGYDLEEPGNRGGNRERYGDDIVDIAAEERARIASFEPAITRDMIDFAVDNEGELVSLKFRLKDESSLARKIADKAADSVSDPREIARGMNDVVRYTMLFDTDSYAAGAASVVEQLEAAGWTVTVKNSWQVGNPYRGINISGINPQGIPVELQLHTPQSYKVKDTVHDIYKRERVETDRFRKYIYHNQMVTLSGRIPTPSGNIRGVGRWDDNSWTGRPGTVNRARSVILKAWGLGDSRKGRDMQDQVRYFKWGEYVLMRFVVQGGGMDEEKFSLPKGVWEPTTQLSELFYTGEFDLNEVSEDEARVFRPTAFEG